MHVAVRALTDLRNYLKMRLLLDFSRQQFRGFPYYETKSLVLFTLFFLRQPIQSFTHRCYKAILHSAAEPLEARR